VRAGFVIEPLPPPGLMKTFCVGFDVPSLAIAVDGEPVDTVGDTETLLSGQSFVHIAISLQ